MHETQKKLLQLAQTRDLGSFSYRKLGSLMGDTHPYQVKHHLDQLIKNGYLIHNYRTGIIRPTGTKAKFDGLISIPILGQANCGPATFIANDELQGFLRVSPSIIATKFLDKLFALLAVGSSMNRADINGSPINEGDYILVRRCEWPEVRSGDYIVSIFDECANVKKLFIDDEVQQIRLVSESEDKTFPIVIANEDLGYFRISGLVEQVIKSPTHGTR